MLYCDTYLLISYYHIGFSATYAVFFGMTSSVGRRPGRGVPMPCCRDLCWNARI